MKSGYFVSLPPTRLIIEPFSVKNQFSWPNCCILISLKSNVLWQIWKVYGGNGRQLEAPNNLSMFYISNRKRFSGLLKNDKVGRFPLMAITNSPTSFVNPSVSLRLSITTLPDFLSLASGTSAILWSISPYLQQCRSERCAPAQCPHNT